jgi:TRAP-type C4-dicarboxylate transport system substrate-binding protein
MIQKSLGCLFWLMLMPCLADAEPARLRLAFFSSDRSTTYVAAIKPFVEAVNSEPGRHVQIDVYQSGVLGRDPTKQLQLVLDGVADLAFIVPGYTPERFSDNAVIELPGLYRGIREVTLVYTRLVGSKALRGYDDLFVVGAFGNELESIHTRPPAASLGALKGMRIRVNNPIQGAALTGLGMNPIQLPVNQASVEIGGNRLDGSMVAPVTVVEFGIARVASHHYLLGVSSPPLAVVMNRAKFEGLAAEAQHVIRKFSGEWIAERYIEAGMAANNAVIESLKQDPNRIVTIPSPSDVEQAHIVFQSKVEAWSAADPRHAGLLAKANALLKKLREPALGSQ